MGNIGYYALLLHFHLPYVKGHDRWPFGEEWLFEAALGSYLPLIRSFYRLIKKGINPSVTLSFTPVLLEQLGAPDFRDSFINYINERIRLLQIDEKNNINKIKSLSQLYQKRIEELTNFYLNELNGDILTGLRRLGEEGSVELITSSATHAYLPLLSSEKSIRLQVQTAYSVYHRLFGMEPNGFWLPECGYKRERKVNENFLSSLDLVLADSGFKYTILETHALDGVYFNGSNSKLSCSASFSPIGCLKPYRFSDSELFFFLRHPRFSYQVWSGEWGYPGDPYYREYHKRKDTSGAQYWQIAEKGADLGRKDFYSPLIAKERVISHISHFSSTLREALTSYFLGTGEKGIIVTPFDAELFGHWWYEGVEWLEGVLEYLSGEKDVGVITLSKFLDSHPPSMKCKPINSSWGEGGGDRVWLNENTAWMWDKIYEAEKTWLKNPSKPGRLITQINRELLLLQSSDWEFLITTGQAKDYAKKRFEEHERNFYLITKMLERRLSVSDETVLREIEEKDHIFLDKDFI